MFTIFTKNFKFVLFSLLFILSFLIMAQVGLALTGAEGANKNLDQTATGVYGGTEATGVPSGVKDNLPVMIGKIIGTLLSFLGVVFFGIILYAGIGWILSLGNEEKITAAKNMIIAAILGLIVVLGAYAITNIVARIFIE